MENWKKFLLFSTLSFNICSQVFRHSDLTGICPLISQKLIDEYINKDQNNLLPREIIFQIVAYLYSVTDYAIGLQWNKIDADEIEKNKVGQKFVHYNIEGPIKFHRPEKTIIGWHFLFGLETILYIAGSAAMFNKATKELMKEIFNVINAVYDKNKSRKSTYIMNAFSHYYDFTPIMFLEWSMIIYFQHKIIIFVRYASDYTIQSIQIIRILLDDERPRFFYEPQEIYINQAHIMIKAKHVEKQNIVGLQGCMPPELLDQNLNKVSLAKVDNLITLLNQVHYHLITLFAIDSASYVHRYYVFGKNYFLYSSEKYEEADLQRVTKNTKITVTNRKGKVLYENLKNFFSELVE